MRFNTPLGGHLLESTNYYSIQAARAVNGVGSAVVILPGSVPRTKLMTDGLLELWRQPAGRAPRLWGETLWFIRDVRKIISGRRRSWKVTAYDGLYLFGDPTGQRGRIVAYNTGNAFTYKTEEADDMAKAVVRENAGTLATDTARDLSAYLAVAADLTAAPVIHKEFARRVLLSVLQEIAQASTTAGTYLAFDVVCTRPPSQVASGQAFGLEFRTYTGQRGIDHRGTSIARQVLIGPDFGNLDDVDVGDDSTDEENYVYAGGQGVANVRAVATATDAARTGLSPFNRRESWLDASDIDNDATALQDAADQALRAGRPRRVLTGTLVDSEQARYGEDWDFGDYLPAQVDGFKFDCRVEALAARVERGKIEKMSASLRGEAV